LKLRDLTPLDFCFCALVKSQLKKRNLGKQDESLSRILDAAARIKKDENQLR
jgi:hypothetical protein